MREDRPITKTILKSPVIHRSSTEWRWMADDGSGTGAEGPRHQVEVGRRITVPA
jgi:hypothetical protein